MIVRERNFYREGDVTHYGQPVKDAARIERIWNELKRLQRVRRQRCGPSANSTPRIRISSAASPSRPSKFGISFTATFFNQAGALVLMYRDGSVQVNHGGTEMGQGLHTKIRQIAAAELGRDARGGAGDADAHRQSAEHFGNRRIGGHGSERRGGARCVPADSIAAGSHRCRTCSSAMKHLCDLKKAGSWRRSTRAIDLAKVVEAAYRSRVALFAHGYYRTPEIHFDPKTATGKPFHYFAYGAAVSEVEVDGFTGEHRILRADLLQDVGDSVSPLVDLGQIEGGFLQGIGWLTVEELLWDAQGRLATGGRVHLQAAFVAGNAGSFQCGVSGTRGRAGRDLRQQSRGRAAADAGDFRCAKRSARPSRHSATARRDDARQPRYAGTNLLGCRESQSFERRPRVTPATGAIRG